VPGSGSRTATARRSIARRARAAATRA
jgi:hypothetical protein